MFSTVFDDRLEDFFYGDTCTEETFGYSRTENAKGFNFIGVKIKIPQMAFGVMFAGSVLVSSATSLGVSLSDTLRNYNMYVPPGITASPSKLDERGRQDLVRRLSKVRNDFGLTQEDMANLLGISKSTVSKMERGEHSPDLSNLSKYQNFLDLANYLNQKLNGKKYVIRQLFTSRSQLFDGMNPIEFSHTIGDEGLDEVIYTFKRQYG